MSTTDEQIMAEVVDIADGLGTRMWVKTAAGINLPAGSILLAQQAPTPAVLSEPACIVAMPFGEAKKIIMKMAVDDAREMAILLLIHQRVIANYATPAAASEPAALVLPKRPVDFGLMYADEAGRLQWAAKVWLRAWQKGEKS